MMRSDVPDAAELFEAIDEAHRSLRPQVPVTPLEYSAALSAELGCELYLKCDHLQPTGSFKFRGACNKLRLLDDGERRRGVVTASTGNHGQAMALAGRMAGVAITVYAPEGATSVKLDRIRSLGATVVPVAGDPVNAELAARRAATELGRLYVSPYNDVQVIAGQGTCGMELACQEPGLAAVFVAVGGGGYVSGIGTALKHLLPATQIIGCWPEHATAMYAALRAGQVVAVQDQETLSDGTAGGLEPGCVTLPLCQRVVDRCVLVSEAEIRAAMRRVAANEHWIVEGSAGVALAAAMQLAPEFQGRKIAVAVCGRNIRVETFLAAVRDAA
ncbi:MAG TPA: threonine/serine dehydratase [Nevskiaceae bacterium]|nr:threonine/serine dehydratase [Nevskiaceae bacterium]